MTRITVLGGYGLLGAELCPALVRAGHEVAQQGRGENAAFRLNPLDSEALKKFVDEQEPDVLVNLIAETNVDACEAHTERAFIANVSCVESIAAVTRRSLVHLIQVSTDQVYSGPGPHSETKPLPCNTYGLTKYAGELVAATANATILRTNFVGRSCKPGRSSLTDWLVSSIIGRREITVFEDVLFAPLHISVLCALIEKAVQIRPPGIFNLGCKDGLSKADFAFELAGRLGLDTSIVRRGRSQDIAGRARRPSDMRMVVDRIENALSIVAPSVQSTLDLLAEEYRDC